MKVAQYEVLGGVKKTTRPGRDDRSLLTLVKPHTRRPRAKTLRSSLRDGRLFLHHFPALRTGLLSLDPSGIDCFAVSSSPGTRVIPIASPYVDAHAQMPCIMQEGRG
jgi:hypothetical protein